MERREALIEILRAGGVGVGAAAAAVWLAARSRRPEEAAAPAIHRDCRVAADPNLPEMVVARGEDPRTLVRRAIEELGGIRRFVARGDVVVLKPNMAWDRTPEQAANTNPEVVAEMARLCAGAGAKKVIIAEVSINDPRSTAERSGIAAAARAAGAELRLAAGRSFKTVDLRGAVLGAWPVYEPFLEADKVFNLPVAKHHSLTGCTLGIKNWYGILGGVRHRLHQRIHESLADLADFMRPTLTLLDAWRVLLRNGPGGGRLEDVALKKTLVAGTDPVALDAWAAQEWWDLPAASLPYLGLAAARGLGTPDFTKLRTRAVVA